MRLLGYLVGVLVVVCACLALVMVALTLVQSIADALP